VESAQADHRRSGWLLDASVVDEELQTLASSPYGLL
jgi:hypothetical protein